jgi:hypothetical protein
VRACADTGVERMLTVGRPTAMARTTSVLPLWEERPRKQNDEGAARAMVVTPDFPKKTKCIPICMPGSSFMHIVT